MDSIWFFIYIMILMYKVFPQYFQNCWMFPWTESNKEKFDQFLTENHYFFFIYPVSKSFTFDKFYRCLFHWKVTHINFLVCS